QAALRNPLRAPAEQPRDRHHRRDRHAARLHRTRTLLALLPVAVRGIPFGNALYVETHVARDRPPKVSRLGIIPAARSADYRERNPPSRLRSGGERLHHPALRSTDRQRLFGSGGLWR